MQSIKNYLLFSLFVFFIASECLANNQSDDVSGKNKASTEDILPSASIVASQLETDVNTIKNTAPNESKIKDLASESKQYEQGATLAELDAKRLLSKVTPEKKQAELDNLYDAAAVNQNKFIELMGDKLAFEKERRGLENQLALEKLRSELRKLNSDYPIVESTFNSNEQNKANIVLKEPYVVMVSEVAGTQRIIVNDSGTIKIVKENENIQTSNGKMYKVLKSGQFSFFLKETVK